MADRAATPHAQPPDATTPGQGVDDHWFDLDRTIAFSDAVIAVAITLLVVTLDVPNVSNQDLGNALEDLEPTIIAFVASFRAAKRVERVLVTARDVRVTHETPTSSRVVWESPTAFTRVAVEKDEERTVGVNLMLSGREIPVAIALSPRERGEFAEALQNAIWEARRERS